MNRLILSLHHSFSKRLLYIFINSLIYTSSRSRLAADLSNMNLHRTQMKRHCYLRIIRALSVHLSSLSSYTETYTESNVTRLSSKYWRYLRLRLVIIDACNVTSVDLLLVFLYRLETVSDIQRLNIFIERLASIV